MDNQQTPDVSTGTNGSDTQTVPVQPNAQTSAPDTLPANFFDQKGQGASQGQGNAPDTLPADFFNKQETTSASSENAQPYEQPGLVSRALETSGVKGMYELGKATVKRPIDLYTQAVSAMHKGDWQGASDAASKMMFMMKDKDNPLFKAAEEIIMHPINEFKEARSESIKGSTPVSDTINKIQGENASGDSSAAFGTMIGSPLESHAAGMIPIVGPALQQIGQNLDIDFHDKNWGAIAGDILGPVMTFGASKLLSSLGEAGEAAEGVAGKVGPGPITKTVAGEKIPVAATNPGLESTARTNAIKGLASEEGAKKFVTEQTNPAATRATHANFSKSALETTDNLRQIRGEEPLADNPAAPKLNTINDISSLMKDEAKKTYSKLDEAAVPEITEWESKYGPEAQAAVKSKPVQLFDANDKLLPQGATEAEIPPKPKTFTELQDQLNNAKDTISNRSASQVDKESAINNLPKYQQDMSQFLQKHADVVNPDELDAANKTYAGAKQFDFIDKQVRSASQGIGKGNQFSADKPMLKPASMESLPRRFDNKFGQGAWENRLGQEGVRNYNDILHIMQTPETGGMLGDMLNKVPLIKAGTVPIEAAMDNILFNPTAGTLVSRLLEKFTAAFGKEINKLPGANPGTSAKISNAVSKVIKPTSTVAAPIVPTLPVSGPVASQSQKDKQKRVLSGLAGSLGGK